MATDPLKPYSVYLEYDGVTDEAPLFSGNRQACLLYIASMYRQKVKGKYALALMNNEKGRLESYVL